MAPRYLIRFDDACPTMNWRVWDAVEAELLKRNIRPIIAVVPDNRDPKLQSAPPRVEFWDRVRSWQSNGWTIGWHGFQHLYESAEAGLVGINRRSEFAGIARDEQQRRLRAANEIFRHEQVRPDLWVAPGHSFDSHTVELLREFAVNVISDGFFTRAVQRLGSIWIPQQLWNFRRMPFGLWTVCYHVNGWSEAALARFRRDIDAFGHQIVSVPEVMTTPVPARTVADALFEVAYRRALVLKRAI